ncbi:MAG: hypothetical protein O3A14_07725 [Cyanobacteria bacterium]|nr:hypothetical protein [Cyanobacteriota bacterium]
MVSTQAQSASPQPSQPPLPPASMGRTVLAVGLIAGLGLLLADLPNLRAWLPGRATAQTHPNSCKAFVQTEATLSREQLAQLLTIPERDSKARVRQVVAEPYCTLASLQVRSGVEAEREAYPLAFDPKTQLVILYENDEYAGYRFNFE